MSADKREQLTLALKPVGADLGEAGRDDDQRADAMPKRRLGRVEHCSSGRADDREIDGVGTSVIAASPRTPATESPLRLIG